MSSDQKARILIIEDELDLLEMLVWSVERIGHIPYPVSTGEEAKQVLEQEPVDMVLLDVLLPGMSGQEICAYIRDFSDIPIIVISALGRSESVVEMLDMGADEYITKPFSFAAVEAQLEAQLRRSPWMTAPKSRPIMSSGGIKIDTKRQTVQVGKRRIRLSDRECSTLAYLMQNPGVPMDTHQICMAVWGEKERKKELALVQTCIQRLRAKIEPDPTQPEYIITVRGYGYKVNTSGSAA